MDASMSTAKASNIMSNGSINEDDKTKSNSCYNDQRSKQRKRGLKPRSQRNRKRPRGGVGILNFIQNHDNECSSTILDENEYKVQIDIKPLDLNSANKSIITKTTNPENSCHVASTTAPTAATNKRIRIVQPYPYTYSTFAKARWNNRTILDVFSNEFGSYPKSYYESAITNGRITVSGTKVSCDYIIKGGDELSHVVHRHEPAVAICDRQSTSCNADYDRSSDNKDDDKKEYIQIIHEDEDIIVVDKPSTVPVHPCGGYNFNSLFYILSNQNPTLEGKLHNVHRLDRLTSGLTIVAKSTDVAKVLGKCINDRDHCHKVYLARVKGKFPLLAPKEKQFDSSTMMKNNDDDADEESMLKRAPFIMNGEWCVEFNESMKLGEVANTFWISNNDGEVSSPKVTLNEVFESRINPNNLTHDGKSKVKHDDDVDDKNSKIYWFNLACPCEIVCHKNGVCEAGNKKGKAAQTAFAVVNYDKETDTTIVLAKPMTGRTHQIRLHLQYLGHPIANDPNYGGEMFFANSKGLELCHKAQQRMIELDESYAKIDHDESVTITNRPTGAISTDIPASEEEIEKLNIVKREECESFLGYLKKTCVWCARNKGEDRTILEFLVRSPGLWLHSYQYSLKGPHGKQFCYSTSLPEWCDV